MIVLANAELVQTKKLTATGYLVNGDARQAC